RRKQIYDQDPKSDAPNRETSLFEWFWDNLDSGGSDRDVLVNEETEFRYNDKEEPVVMKLVNDGGGEGCAIEEENKLIDVRCINRKLNKKQIEDVNCKDKPVSDESNHLGVRYKNGMFERKSKHNEDRKVFVNDKKDDSAKLVYDRGRLNQLEERKVEYIPIVSEIIDLNRGETDGVIEVVDALLDVVMKTEKHRSNIK
ncbi:1991_t:CDS:1, partial [Gigaspora rosea]